MPKTVAMRVREAREDAGLEREDLATAVGVHVGSVNRWETGGAEPTDHNLRKIADATGRTFEWLKHEDEPPEPGTRDDLYEQLANILRDQGTTLLEKRAAMLDLALTFRADALRRQEINAERQMEEIREGQRAAKPVPQGRANPQPQPTTKPGDQPS